MNEYLVIATFRVALLILAGAAASALLRRKSAALRAAAWTAVAGVAIFLPILPALSGSVNLPVGNVVMAEETPTPGQSQLSIGVLEGPSPASQHVKHSLPASRTEPISPLAALYFGGIGLSVLWFLGGLVGANRILRKAKSSATLTQKAQSIAHEMGVLKGPKVLLGPAGMVPFTIGATRPVILLPEGADAWDEQRLIRVMRHEIGHVARGDWAVVTLSRIACAVHWFNPLVWMAAQELRQECEKAADDLALNALETSLYASELLGWAKAISAPTVALPMARPSNMGKRIRHVLDGAADRSQVSGGLKSFIAGACVLGALMAPGIQTTQNEMQLRVQGLDHAKHLALAYILYLNDYDDTTPYVDETETVRRVTYPYLVPNKGQVRKPIDNWKTMNPAGSEFLINLCLGGISDTNIPKPTYTPLFYENKPWKDGKRIVSFEDGHVQVLGPVEWKEIEKNLHLNIKRTITKVLKAPPIDYDDHIHPEATYHETP